MRRVVSVLLTIAFVFGIGLAIRPAARAQESTPIAGDAATLAANKELVRRYFAEALSLNQPELIEELFSPDFVFHVNGTELVGWEATKEFVTGVKGGFPDGTWAPQDIIAEGDLVGIRTSVSGTNTGSFRGLPASGGRAEGVPAMAIFRVADGKLVEAWGEDNFMVVGQQLGTAPAPFGRPTFTEPGSVVGPETSADVHAANKAVVQRLLDEAWSGGNAAVVDELYAPDVINRPTAAGQGVDLNAIRTAILIYRAGLPDLKITADLMAAEGDEVMTRFTLTGTDTGGLFGFPPTSNPIEATGLRIDRLEDGKIVETWIVIDNLRIFGELGMLGAPSGSPAAG